MSRWGSLFLALAIAACSAQQPVRTKVVWQKLDGTPATQEEIDAAGRYCAVETHQQGGEGEGRFDHIQWAVRMIECMKREGYVRVEQPESP